MLARSADVTVISRPLECPPPANIYRNEEVSPSIKNIPPHYFFAPTENFDVSHFSVVPPHEGHNDCLLPTERPVDRQLKLNETVVIRATVRAL